MNWLALGFEPSNSINSTGPRWLLSCSQCALAITMSIEGFDDEDVVFGFGKQDWDDADVLDSDEETFQDVLMRFTNNTWFGDLCLTPDSLNQL